jgi:hypothetical protein
MKPTLFLLLSLVGAPSALAQGAAVALDRPAPVTVKLADARLEDALATVCRLAGLTIQWDAKFSVETRSRTLTGATVNFVDTPAADALAFLTKQVGLTYVVVDGKTVRITMPAR